MVKEFEDLGEQDTNMLNKKGWHFVTYFKSKESSRAYNLAVEKSFTLNRKCGFKRYEKDGYFVWELWEKW